MIRKGVFLIETLWIRLKIIPNGDLIDPFKDPFKEPSIPFLRGFGAP